jgi:hypothetical protein
MTAPAKPLITVRNPSANCVIVERQGGRRCVLAGHSARLLKVFTHQILNETPSDPVPWAVLNAVFSARDDASAMANARKELENVRLLGREKFARPEVNVRKALERLRARLKDGLQRPPEGGDWLVTFRQVGVALTSVAEWACPEAGGRAGLSVRASCVQPRDLEQMQHDPFEEPAPRTGRRRPSRRR